MLQQFRSQYPTASLISELLTVYQGKFVVRVLAQVEGLTKATGMAAAETIELAEDQARSRAIAVLLTDQVSSEPEIEEPIQIDPELKPPISQNDYSAYTTEFNNSALPLEQSTPTSEEFLATSHAEDTDFGQHPPINSVPTQQKFDFTVDEFDAGFNTDTDINSTPLEAPSYNPEEKAEASTQKKAKPAKTASSEPIDLSDVIAKTDVELSRLKWTKEQGRDYLIRKYNKRGRTLLTDQELLEFLDYLESQPNPS